MALASSVLSCADPEVIGTDPVEAPAAEVVIPDDVPPVPLRRLSHGELDNVVADLLGDTTRPATRLLPPDKYLPFDNVASEQPMSPAVVETQALLARDVAERLVDDDERLVEVVGCDIDRECVGAFLPGFLRRAFRRPATDTELAGFSALLDEVDDPLLQLQLVVEAVLQSPPFLYVLEVGEPVVGRDDVRRLTDYEVAQRLALVLWGSIPDQALLERAAAGELSDTTEVHQAATAMLHDPRALRRVADFHAMWLGYRHLPQDDSLPGRMRRETDELVAEAAFGDDWRWLMTAEGTWVDRTLARHYGLEPLPDNDDGLTWIPYDERRRGVLSHGSLLSLGAKFNDTSPTIRGLLVRTRLMCQDIPPPPPDVDTDEPPGGNESSVCKSTRYRAHREVGACRGCHNLIDPIGFGMENFDAAGRFREHEAGAPQCEIDGDGEVFDVGTFNGPAELGQLLVDSGHVSRCLVTQLFRFYVGRMETSADRELLDRLYDDFVVRGHRFDRLLLGLVSSKEFLFRTVEEGS